MTIVQSVSKWVNQVGSQLENEFHDLVASQRKEPPPHSVDNPLLCAVGSQIEKALGIKARGAHDSFVKDLETCVFKKQLMDFIRREKQNSQPHPFKRVQQFYEFPKISIKFDRIKDLKAQTPGKKLASYLSDKVVPEMKEFGNFVERKIVKGVEEIGNDVWEYLKTAPAPSQKMTWGRLLLPRKRIMILREIDSPTLKKMAKDRLGH